MIKHDNKIKIPWYRKDVKPTQYEDIPINPIASKPSIDVNKPKGDTKQPQEESIRVPVKSPVIVTVPSTIIIPNPINNPFTFPKAIGGYNPNPFPPFVPNPNRVPPLPQPNPVLQSTFSDDSKKWIDNFVKNIGYVASITGISVKDIYNFVANYDFENKGIKGFRKDTKEEFGFIAATLLTIAIVGKQLIGLWGKRASTIFSPPIILDDNFYKENFDNDNIDA